VENWLNVVFVVVFEEVQKGLVATLVAKNLVKLEKR
jgi:hypothetical protein